MMSSHCLYIWAPIGCRRATQWVRQPVLFRWELVSSSHRPSQSASPVWKLLTETFLPSWCFGIYQASAASSIIHNLSSGFLCLSVCLFVSVCVCQCVPQCVWSQHALIKPLGSPAPLSESAFSLCFLEHTLVSADIHRTGARCLICGLYSTFTLNLFMLRTFTGKNCWLFLIC